MGHIRTRRLSQVPLLIVELCGGLATGLEAVLRAGYAINSYAWVDIDPYAHIAVSHRIADLRLKFPLLIPSKGIKD